MILDILEDFIYANPQVLLGITRYLPVSLYQVNHRVGITETGRLDDSGAKYIMHGIEIFVAVALSRCGLYETTVFAESAQFVRPGRKKHIESLAPGACP